MGPAARAEALTLEGGDVLSRGSSDSAWRRRRGHAPYEMLDVIDPSAGRRALLHCEPDGLVESFRCPAGGGGGCCGGAGRISAHQGRSAFYMSMAAPAAGLTLQAREALIRTLGTAPLRAWAAGLVTMRGI